MNYSMNLIALYWSVYSSISKMEDRVDECVEMFLDRQKLKAKKDPNRPKKMLMHIPSSAMIIAQYSKKKSGGKKLDFGKMNKDLGKAWRGLKKGQREKYETMAAEDAERYRAEMEDYNASLGL